MGQTMPYCFKKLFPTNHFWGKQIQSDLVINFKSSRHSSSQWDLSSTYNVNLLNTYDRNGSRGCKSSNGGALLFNFHQPMSPSCLYNSVNYTINSRQLVSTVLDSSNITLSSLEPGAVVSHTTLPDQETINQMSSLENAITARIIANEEYDQILNMV